MLIGTTFAWFTDEVKSVNNKIVAGTLKIDLEVLEKDNVNWTSIKDSPKAIFDYEKWEPGYTDVKILKDGAGSLVVLDGKLRDPENISALSFDGDSLGRDWITTAYRFYTGSFTRVGIGVVDGGGSALIDNVRLFKASDGTAGDDTYKDPVTGSTVTAPTATAKPTGTASVGTQTTGSTVTVPSESVTAPTDVLPTEPSQGGEETTSTTPVGDTPTDTDPNPKDEGGFPWLVVGVVGGAVLLIGGGVALFLILRKKKQA